MYLRANNLNKQVHNIVAKYVHALIKKLSLFSYMYMLSFPLIQNIIDWEVRSNFLWCMQFNFCTFLLQIERANKLFYLLSPFCSINCLNHHHWSTFFDDTHSSLFVAHSSHCPDTKIAFVLLVSEGFKPGTVSVRKTLTLLTVWISIAWDLPHVIIVVRRGDHWNTINVCIFVTIVHCFHIWVSSHHLSTITINLWTATTCVIAISELSAKTGLIRQNEEVWVLPRCTAKVVTTRRCIALAAET